MEVLGFNLESLMDIGHGLYHWTIASGFKMLSVVSGKIKTRKKHTRKADYSQTLTHFMLRYMR